jgi:hypothetical protein
VIYALKISTPKYVAIEVLTSAMEINDLKAAFLVRCERGYTGMRWS